MDMASIYDAAVNVYSRNFSLVVAAIALITVPSNLLGGLIQEQGGTVGQGIGLVIDGVAVFLAAAMAAIIVDDLIAGRVVTVGSVWRRMGGLMWPLVATFVLYALAVVGGFVLFVAPAFLIANWFALAAPVVAIEHTRYGAALGRSRELVKRSWWRTFGILILAGFMVLLAEGACSAAAQALIGSNAFAGVIAGAAIAILTQPLVALITVMLYVDLKLRHEGSDLRAAIEAL
jgi:hypothetical protein